jgi:hypothetical protein
MTSEPCCILLRIKLLCILFGSYVLQGAHAFAKAIGELCMGGWGWGRVVYCKNHVHDKTNTVWAIARCFSVIFGGISAEVNRSTNT